MPWYYWAGIVIGALLLAWGAFALGVWIYIERTTEKVPPPRGRKEYERKHGL